MIWILQTQLSPHTAAERRITMGVILGIDIGGSSTKIVGLRPDQSVIDMLRVKAAYR